MVTTRKTSLRSIASTFRPWIVERGWWGLVACSLSVGCAGSTSVRLAQLGQHHDLKVELKSHPPSAGQTRKIAQAVLKHEVINAKDKDDRAFIKTIVACSSGLSDALSQRAKQRDGTGAEAAMVLLELNQWPSPEKFKNDDDGAWRALTARASANDPALRKRYYTDPDERVRQAALVAAGEAQANQDVNDLLEVARLDPDPLTRSRAIITLGHLSSDEIVRRLRDLYPTVDEALRLAIVQTWGSPRQYDIGGRRELERLISDQAGLEAVTAASVLARDPDPDVYQPAITRLLRFATEGTLDERRLALVTMPLHHASTSKLLVQSGEASDVDVAIIAWSRLLQHKDYQAKAEDMLLGIVKSSNDPAAVLQAQSALAAGGSLAIRDHLVKQLTNSDPTQRRLAASALIRLGQLSEIAPLLADEINDVRRTISCQILGAPPLPVAHD